MKRFPQRDREREKKFHERKFPRKKMEDYQDEGVYIYTVLTSGVVNFVFQLLR